MDYIDADRQLRSALADYEKLRERGGEVDDVEVRVIREATQVRLFDSRLTVGHVLEATGLRDHNVQTRYHQLTGETVWQYITRCRVEAAMHLLEVTTAPIYLVGRAVGYTSCETFDRRFKRVTGLCPNRFRHIRSLGLDETK